MSELALSSIAMPSWWQRLPSAGAATARDVADRLRFVRTWLAAPSRTAAIAPSGRALAALITREIDRDTGPVLELGAGTGAFTAALIGRGVAEADITLVEQDQGFGALLHQRYPAARLLRIDAATLGDHLSADHVRFGAAICGLGLLTMPPPHVEAILHATWSRLAPGAALYLFTYGRRCSVPRDVMERLHLRSTGIGTTLRNLPPATVFRIERHADAPAGDAGQPW